MTTAEVEYVACPRLAGVAEKGWSPAVAGPCDAGHSTSTVR